MTIILIPNKNLYFIGLEIYFSPKDIRGSRMSNIKMGIDALGAANNIERCKRKNIVLYQFTSARTCNGCPA